MQHLISIFEKRVPPYPRHVAGVIHICKLLPSNELWPCWLHLMNGADDTEILTSDESSGTVV